MRSLTRIGLPILLVAGLVFGITFVQMYSGGDDGRGGDPVTPKASRKEVLRFSQVLATPGSHDENTPKHSWYWGSELEVGESGHFEYWCQNRNLEPVNIRVPYTNCQCAGVHLAVVDRAALGEYRVLSALAGGPLSPAGPLSAVVHARFDRALKWEPLYEDGVKHDRMVPAADPAAGAQVALVKLKWSGKDSRGKKRITGTVYASIGEADPVAEELAAEITIISGYAAFRREGLTGWTSADTLQMGELRENGLAKQSFFLVSYTRSEGSYLVGLEHPDPCISIAAPVPATAEEMASLVANGAQVEGATRRPKSAYRVDVTVRERVEVDENGKKSTKHMDLGAFDRRLTVSTPGALAADAMLVTLRGRVFGEVSIVGTAESAGRIEMGTSFAADQDRTQVLTLAAERPGLELSLLSDETTPSYLKAKLEPTDPRPDGRKQWKLRVTVPKNELYGSLPPGSGVYLQTNSTPPRRLRLPVRGSTYDTGGPRL